MNDLTVGDIVSLIFDSNKRFLVTGHDVVNNDYVIVCYFNEYHGEIRTSSIQTKYLRLETKAKPKEER